MLRLTFKIKKDVTKDTLLNEICSKNRININDIIDWHIVKKSIVHVINLTCIYVYVLDFKFKNEIKYSRIKGVQIINDLVSANAFIVEHKNFAKRPVIVGAGPAGLFAAITFVENGFPLLLLNKGKSDCERQNDISNFINTGK